MMWDAKYQQLCKHFKLTKDGKPIGNTFFLAKILKCFGGFKPTLFIWFTGTCNKCIDKFFYNIEKSNIMLGFVILKRWANQDGGAIPQSRNLVLIWVTRTVKRPQLLNKQNQPLHSRTMRTSKAVQLKL